MQENKKFKLVPSKKTTYSDLHKFNNLPGHPRKTMNFQAEQNFKNNSLLKIIFVGLFN